MGFKKGNPGRPVGAVNRLNAEVKDVLVRAYHDLGGFKAFMKWLREDQEHLDHFYQHMYMKLLPMQVNVDKTENVVYKSYHEVSVALADHGISLDSIEKLKQLDFKPPILDDEGVRRVQEYGQDWALFRGCRLASNQADALSCHSLLQ